MRKKTLTNQALNGEIVFVILLLVFICAGITVLYFLDTKKTYSINAFSITRSASEYIDGDAVKRYYETNEKDDYYEQIQNYLNSYQIQSNAKYFYVFVPTDDDVVYIWDANHYDGYCELGHHEEYMDEGSKENAFNAFKQNPNEKLIINFDKTYGFIASACSPVFDSDGNPVAMVAVDIEMEGLLERLSAFIYVTAIITLCASFLGGIYLYRFIKNRIIKHISDINDAAKDLVNNLESEETYTIDINTGDEIEELAGSFNQMNHEVRDYIEQLKVATAEKQRISAELDLATKIQADMLPSIFPAFPDRKEFDLFASMNPAKEVGGDFYDFFLVDSDHLGLVVADVSDKGIPAAMFMMYSKNIIANNAMLGKSPAVALYDSNSLICMNNNEGMFVTVWLGILEISTGILTYADAGHEKMALYQNGYWQLVNKKYSGIALGMFDNTIIDSMAEKYRLVNQTIKLSPGDALFQYTDGVTEAATSSREMFGEARLVQALDKSNNSDPNEYLPFIRNEIKTFIDGAAQFDDITMLGIRYNGCNEGGKENA